MRIESSLKKRDYAIMRLRDLYSSARIFGPTSAEMNQAYSERVLGQLGKCPAWVYSYLDGYRKALDDSLYRNNLVFGCWIDGVFHSNHRGRPDYYEKLGKSPRIYAEESRNRTGHYWSHNLKPFFVNSESES